MVERLAVGSGQFAVGSWQFAAAPQNFRLFADCRLSTANCLILFLFLDIISLL